MINPSTACDSLLLAFQPRNMARQNTCSWVWSKSFRRSTIQSAIRFVNELWFRNVIHKGSSDLLFSNNLIIWSWIIVSLIESMRVLHTMNCIGHCLCQGWTWIIFTIWYFTLALAETGVDRPLNRTLALGSVSIQQGGDLQSLTSKISWISKTMSKKDYLNLHEWVAGKFTKKHNISPSEFHHGPCARSDS
jgi:hypothetical protein